MLDTIHAAFYTCSTLLDHVVSRLVGIIVVIMSVSIVTQVIFRYVVGKSLSWPEEVTVFMMAWLTFLGGSMGVWRSSHINVDFFVTKLPLKIRAGIRLGVHGVVLAFCAFLFAESFSFASESMAFRSDGLRIPLAYPRLCVPLGATVMLIHCVTLILGDLRDMRGTATRGAGHGTE